MIFLLCYFMFFVYVNFLIFIFACARASACARLFLYFYFSLVFINLFLFLSLCFVYLFYRREACGSGARGLIKAPAGSGAGPGERSEFILSLLGGMFCPPALAGGLVGGKPVVVLGIYRLTDTLVSVFGGFYGVR